ncbi:hypothetical protein HNQ93_002675 [Hymenobacter luteus]|uniref:Tetratricopeptide repeat protein n=2 Tax=Hymenobacter TaxID=89966 RepID=A0A7W9T1J3_9BACT|nr:MULTISPECIES: hypothetical protein [Hymenobacter]MBB4601756.1 hypothetical protein [Hymenobacter latericoloratus]MBB6059815.1 hypothetical protein [Hymenobacter luteus]
MTRASLLHILDHVNGISNAEVRELEQLAAAFPYCQTAHVLLAKAAHDRGSMLASQRLRRAATYAADRNLLRQLLEQPATPEIAVMVPEAVAPGQAAQPEADVFATFLPDSSVATSAEGPGIEPALPEPASGAPQVEEPVAVVEAPPSDEQEAQAPTPSIEHQEEPVTEPTIEPLSEVEATSTADVLVLEPEMVATTPTSEEAPEPITEQPAAKQPEAEEAEADQTFFQEVEPIQSEPDPAPAEATSVPELVSSEETAPEADLLPAVAPPIRPPADAGISRFEFGLSEPDLPAPSGYLLPGLDDADEEDELPTLRNTSAPLPVVSAPFRSDKEVGYALGAGSRLGYDLQPHDGYTLDLPLDAFFEPDALLLAYLKNNKPTPQASSLDLINQFLKTQPRIKTPVGAALPAEEQADLSVRSTSTPPALASESLAKIMVRQGKREKAIEIYERLMERQPEKKAYFAEQIQQLQQSPE